MPGASDCPMVSRLVHRLKHLFYELMDPVLVDLLMGPLVDWIESTVEDEAAATLALRMSTAGTLRHRIATRMCALHMLSEWTFPDEAHVPYMLGIMIDLHVPSLSQTSIHIIYEKQCAPEQLSISEVYHDEYASVSIDFLARLWRPFDETPIVRRRENKGKTVFKDLPDGCVLDLDPSPANETQWRILRKGMHNASTTRSIVELYTASPCREHIERSFRLGAYRHARSIAPPWMRENICLEIPKASEIVHVLSEFIYANTQHLTSLYRHVNNERLFYAHAVHVCEILRTRWYGGTLKVPRYSVAMEHYDGVRLFWALVNKIKANSAVKISDYNIAGKPRLALLKQHPNRFHLYGEYLAQIGMNESDLQHLAELNEIGNPHKVVTRVLGRLSATGRVLLRLYVMYLLHRSRLSIHPFHGRGKGILYVCECCFTIRTSCRFLSGAKSPNGLVYDFVEGVHRCNECLSDDVRAVDLQTHYVYGLAPGTSSYAAYTSCTRCNTPSEMRYIVGTDYYCRMCYQNHIAPQSVQMICFCGRRIDKRGGGSTLMLDKGEVILSGLCHRHVHLKTRVHPHDIPPKKFFQSFL